MTADEIKVEFERNKKLSPRAMRELTNLIASDDPFAAITVAADIGCVEVAGIIAKGLSSTDAMVRWNAAATLFTRFRAQRYINECLELAKNELDEVVRSVSLVGLGEFLPLTSDKSYRHAAARELLRVLDDQSEYPEIRCAAYEGILAGLGIAPSVRPPAGKLLDLLTDVDREKVQAFSQRFM